MRIFFYFIIAFYFVGCASTVEEVKPVEPSVAKKVIKAPELKQVEVKEQTKIQELQPITVAKAEIAKVEAVKIAKVPTHAMRVKSMQIKSSPLEYVSKDLSKTDNTISELPQNTSNISEVVQFDNENFDEVVDIFINNCKSATTRKMYGSLCDSALHVSDKKVFIKKNFKLYKIVDNQKDEGVLTGYYEPELHGSLTKHDKYVYPIYQKPLKTASVESSVVHTEANSSTTQDNTRADLNALNTPTLCYVDDKIDAFFLEIQGSGRVNLDTNETLYVGYSGTNGQKYSSIGKYLIDKGYMSANHMSLEEIKAWAHKNPDKIDNVLNHNERVVYFKKRDSDNVTGSLGIPLTPMRSVAVDSAYVPLGSMLLIDAQDYKHSIKNIVFAQDRGAAIKSAIRADLFTGYGKQALAIAGNLKAKLKMWIFLPKVQVQ